MNKPNEKEELTLQTAIQRKGFLRLFSIASLVK